MKPELFKHEELFELEQETGLPIRIAFIGLFTCCDREGRFKWRPRSLKLEACPYDDCDFSRVLDALTTRGFVVKYAVNGEEYGVITTFLKHQIINNREAASEIPAPYEDITKSGNLTRDARVDDASVTRYEGKGREGKGKEAAAAREHGGFDDEPAAAAAPEKIPVEPIDADGRDPEFDRVEHSCRQALGDAAPADPVIGPMVALVRAGHKLQQLTDILRSEARRPRRKPVRTWGLWASICADAIAGQQPIPQAQASEPISPDVWRRRLEKFVTSEHWPAMYGPRPGLSGCMAPADLVAIVLRQTEVAA